MKHAKTIIALGILVALLPFLGFPSSWKGVIFAFLGLTIAALSFRLFIASIRNTTFNAQNDSDDSNIKEDVVHTAEVVAAHE